jgi:hypothetical protein
VATPPAAAVAVFVQAAQYVPAPPVRVMFGSLAHVDACVAAATLVAAAVATLPAAAVAVVVL